MKVWVDADACPKVIKEILFKAAQRTHIHTTLVANHAMSIPPSEYIQFIHVPSGFDVADDEIVKHIESGDLLISSDIPLADEAIDKGAVVLSPRGELLTKENIGARLNMRDFLDTLRSSGIDTGGQAAMSASDRQHFANQLDKILTKALRLKI